MLQQKFKAIFTRGVSGSGKTTWANQYKKDNQFTCIISRDDYRQRFMEDQLGKDFSWKDWNWKNESKITDLINHDLEQIVGKMNIIIADTNLNEARLKQYMGWFEGIGYDVEVKDFDVPLDECVKRDLNRRHSVGRDVIQKQWMQLNVNKPKYVGNPNNPKAIIIDVDGTVADKGTRCPFEWMKVGEDKPIMIVIDIVQGFLEQGYIPLIFSGRDSVCYDLTYDWLNTNVFVGTFWYDCFSLFMREEGDMRKDSIVKKEFFDLVKDRFNIVAAIDDRLQVLELWTDLGIKTINVGNIYERF